MAKRPLSPPIVGELLSLMNASGFSYEPRTNAGFGESLYSLYHSDMKIREVIPRGCIREFIDGWNLAIKHFNLSDEVRSTEPTRSSCLSAFGMNSVNPS